MILLMIIHVKKMIVKKKNWCNMGPFEIDELRVNAEEPIHQSMFTLGEEKQKNKHCMFRLFIKYHCLVFVFVYAGSAVLSSSSQAFCSDLLLVCFNAQEIFFDRFDC